MSVFLRWGCLGSLRDQPGRPEDVPAADCYCAPSLQPVLGTFLQQQGWPQRVERGKCAHAHTRAATPQPFLPGFQGTICRGCRLLTREQDGDVSAPLIAPALLLRSDLLALVYP